MLVTVRDISDHVIDKIDNDLSERTLQTPRNLVQTLIKHWYKTAYFLGVDVQKNLSRASLEWLILHQFPLPLTPFLILLNR
jgi:hypothetical protein